MGLLCESDFYPPDLRSRMTTFLGASHGIPPHRGGEREVAEEMNEAAHQALPSSRVSPASRHCDALLKELFVEAIPRKALEAADGAPRIPSLLGMVCRACACSNDDGCAEGCDWAENSLCTRCAGAGGGVGARRSAA